MTPYEINLIKNKLLVGEILLKTSQKEYNKLNQIDALSGEGYALRTSMNKQKGYIECLKWILKNKKFK